MEGVFIGSVRSHIVDPSLQNMSDPDSKEGYRRKSGAAETLTSHAGEDNLDIVQSGDFLLHEMSARSAWLPPSELLKAQN